MEACINKIRIVQIFVLIQNALKSEQSEFIHRYMPVN